VLPNWGQIPEARARSCPSTRKTGHLGAGRRLDYFTNKVQPGDPGAPPARLGVQALPVFRPHWKTDSRPQVCLLDAPIVMEGDASKLPGARRTRTANQRPDALREALVKSTQPGVIRLLRELGRPTRRLTLLNALWLRQADVAPEPDTGIGHGPSRRRWNCNRVRSVRKRRFPRDAVLRGPHRERRRPVVSMTPSGFSGPTRPPVRDETRS